MAADKCWSVLSGFLRGQWWLKCYLQTDFLWNCAFGVQAIPAFMMSVEGILKSCKLNRANRKRRCWIVACLQDGSLNMLSFFWCNSFQLWLLWFLFLTFNVLCYQFMRQSPKILEALWALGSKCLCTINTYFCLTFLPQMRFWVCLCEVWVFI